MFFGLLTIAALGKAIMDACAHGVFAGHPFLDETIAWHRKWKWTEVGTIAGERFLGSSTVFSFVTSGWHLSQFIFLNAIIGSVFFYDGITRSSVADFVIVSVGFRVVFEATYRILKG